MDALEACAEKMRAEGLSQLAIDTFSYYHRLLSEGEQGTMPEEEIEPVESLPDLSELPEPDPEVLDQVAIVKLNGGLGTSMGMTGPKSLVVAKDGQTFLDLIVRQVMEGRRRHGARLPLVLMNSFRTREASLEALGAHADIGSDLPPDFLQGKVPKVRADDLRPVEWPDDPELEWTPPGHGDVYTSLAASGMLDELLGHGYRYAFLSNSDNLGAAMEPRVPGWLAAEGIPFAMEACDRTESDRKGGHIARARDGGGLVLRESAQVPDEDAEAFQDVGRHRFFNTNTLWVDLQALSRLLEERGGVLGLPMIVNRKTVDPSDSSSPEVIQLETAMGAAIGVFEGAAAVHVPRRRFVPVKTTADLLALRSDAYVMREDAGVELAPERGDKPPVIDLDDEHYKLLPDFERHFPEGPPSLAGCDRLEVDGDVTFGRDVVVRGRVSVEGPAKVEDGTVLEG
ncbi:MAG TPA: UTP--glucose-1-phosphate uridylyltransferase [Thermoleophilaceae bacterium]